MPVGLRVTLRRSYMYNFFYRLVNIALPRVRDFRGVSPRSFDGTGNYTLGLADQSVLESRFIFTSSVSGSTAGIM